LNSELKQATERRSIDQFAGEVEIFSRAGSVLICRGRPTVGAPSFLRSPIGVGAHGGTPPTNQDTTSRALFFALSDIVLAASTRPSNARRTAARGWPQLRQYFF